MEVRDCPISFAFLTTSFSLKDIKYLHVRVYLLNSACRLKYTLSLILMVHVNREMVECFQQISEDTDCRAVVLTGAGKIFTAGKHSSLGHFIFDHQKPEGINMNCILSLSGLEFTENFKMGIVMGTCS